MFWILEVLRLWLAFFGGKHPPKHIPEHAPDTCFFRIETWTPFWLTWGESPFLGLHVNLQGSNGRMMPFPARLLGGNHIPRQAQRRWVRV